MGNSDNTPNDGKLSLDTSAPLWSALLSDVAKGMPIERFSRVKPKGLVTRAVDAFTGLKPSGSTRRTVDELFIDGTEPSKAASASTVVDIDAASGLRWQDGCVGPMVTRAYMDYSKIEGGPKSWVKADLAWQARASRGSGVAGGPKRHAHLLLLRRRVLPVRPELGQQRHAAEQEVPARPAANPRRASPDFFNPCLPPEARTDNDNGNGGGPGNGGGGEEPSKKP